MRDERMTNNSKPEFVAVGRGKALLSDLLDVAFCVTSNSYAVGWKVTDKGFVLFWHDESDGNNPHPFPTRMAACDLTDTVWAWLNEAEYPETPKHDGSNTKGFRVYTETWGRIGDDRYSFLAIQPCWIEHGK